MSTLLTASRLASARACQRLHWYEYIAGYRPISEKQELRFGRLMHLGLEAWWRAEPTNRLRAAVEALAVEADPFDQARAIALLAGYDTRWSDEPYDVLGVEVEFRAKLVNPETGKPSPTWQLGGKLDGIVRDRRDGQVRIIEHKTAGSDISVGSDYWRRLRIDSQASLYFDGAKALGHEPVSVIYDVIAKPKLRPLTATPEESRKYTKDGRLYANQRDTDETPEEFADRLVAHIDENRDQIYARGEVVRLESELDEARFDVWQTAAQLREAMRAKRFPRNAGACVRFGSTCPWLDVCSGSAEYTDPTRFVRLERMHPELNTSDSPAEVEHAAASS